MEAVSVMEREMSVFKKEREALEELREVSERLWKLFSEAAPEVAVAEAAGAANKLAWSAIESALVGYAMPPAGAKKTKTVRVKQEYIDWLLTRAPDEDEDELFMPEEDIQQMIPESQEKIRAIQARMAAAIKATHDGEEDILEQYRAKGYAEVEVEDEEGVDMGN